MDADPRSETMDAYIFNESKLSLRYDMMPHHTWNEAAMMPECIPIVSRACEQAEQKEGRFERSASNGTWMPSVGSRNLAVA